MLALENASVAAIKWAISSIQLDWRFIWVCSEETEDALEGTVVKRVFGLG